MKNFIAQKEKEIEKVLLDLGYEIDNVSLVPSSRKELGQYQFNGVMQLAKKYQKNSINIANEIVEKLSNISDFYNINIAGPGFINISIKDESLTSYIEYLRNEELDFKEDNKKKIVIDYGGPNVAKTLHVGHLRSANIGEALKRLAKELGHDVISDIHLGDWGRPLGLVILELQNRYPDWPYFDENYEGEYPDECPITNEDLENLYPIASQKAKEDEEYLEKARIITTKLQQKQRGYYDLWQKIREISVNEIKKVYEVLNVSFDLWEGESDADEYVEDVINFLKEKGLVKESEGAQIIEVAEEKDNFPMPPLMLVKSNDSISYETTDLATIWERMHKFNPNEIWYVVDKRQKLHFDQVFRASRKSNIVNEDTVLDFIGFGTMNGSDGKPFKTRDGGVMTLNNLIESLKEETAKKLDANIENKERINETLAIAALKYADLLPDVSTDYVFDIEKFSDLNGKTGIYILYSAIRMKSLLKKAKESNIIIGPITDIKDDMDRDLYLKLLEVNQVLNKSLKIKSLHEITEYLFGLTNLFNTFYATNKVLTEEDKKLQSSWLGLTETSYKIIEKLLDILAIEIPEKM